MANYYSEKQIEKAREIDLMTYLQTYEHENRQMARRADAVTRRGIQTK